MLFVWSVWWIVIAVLVLAVVGTMVAFILMDKKDRVIIEDFKKAPMPKNEDEPKQNATE